MERSKSSISDAESYKGIGDFWDEHDLGEHWEETHPVEFSVNLQSEATYFAVENGLSNQIRHIAKRRGVSPETLLNLWLQERLQKEHTGSS